MPQSDTGCPPTPRPQIARRRVLFAAHSAAQGGAELCLDTTLTWLDRAGYEPLAAFAWDGPMADSARRRGAPTEILRFAWWLWGDGGRWYWKNLLLGAPVRIWKLVRLIRRLHVDLVYTNSATIFEPALAAMLARVPHVWHVHEVLAPEHTAPRLLPLWLIKRLIGWLSSRVVFESQASRDVCARAIPEHKSTAIYNSARFPLHNDSNACTKLRQSLGIDPDQCVVAWIGQFSDRKNPRMLIRAIERMKRADRAVFLLVGEGPLEATIRNDIAQRGLEQRCLLPGFQPDVEPLLQAADFLVLTSRQESFGLVLVEAAALGRPAVATRTQGPAEILVDGETGFLVSPDDEASLADRMDRLIEDLDCRQRMGRAAAERAARLFSPEKNTRRIEAVIETAIARTAPRDL